MSNICSQLHNLFNALPRFHYPFNREEIILNGIYILFEVGEYAHGEGRIVRVGTHRGNNRLYNRLQEHFIKENKDRSILRKNIGRALLHKRKDPFWKQWDWKLNTNEAREQYLHLLDTNKLRQVEEEVSRYIQEKFSFVIFAVETKEERLMWEKKIISTIAKCKECKPSSTWLGLFSPLQKIRDSGLWNVQGLNNEEMTLEEFEKLKRKVDSFYLI